MLLATSSSAHLFNPNAYFGHSWSYFDIQNLRLVIPYLTFVLTINVDADVEGKCDHYVLPSAIFVTCETKIKYMTNIINVSPAEIIQTEINPHILLGIIL